MEYNDPLKECLDNAISFSSIYDSSSIDPLTVPCGTCVLMDYTDGSTLEIPGGLHVLGRLHFDPLSSVIVRTTGVFVQGSWSMEIPNEGNQVKILLHGFEEQTLYPHDLCCTGNVFHINVCDEECEDKKGVGKKPFVVAGGEFIWSYIAKLFLHVCFRIISVFIQLISYIYPLHQLLRQTGYSCGGPDVQILDQTPGHGR